MIARVIKDNTIPHVQRKDTLNKEGLINDISIEFKKDNSLFNRDKFVKACND
jgi:hypothetical protein